MTISFRTKLLASHVLLVVAAFVIAISALDRWLTADLVRQLDARLEQQARGAAEWSDEGGKRHPDKVASRIARIVAAEVTLFDKVGTVIGSSTNARTDVGNEVRQAIEEGVGRATRPHGSENVHYVAVRGEDGIVIRIAAPLSEINETVADIRTRMMFASAVAIAVAIALGILASNVGSKPFVEAIGELRGQRDQLTAILGGMAEGVLVLNDDRSVLVANPAIEKILGKKELDDDLFELVKNADENEIELVDRRGASLAIYKRSLTQGAMVVVVRDMTALRRLMTVRRDFVANVSHELRTPVTAIQGYAETLLRGTDPKTTGQFLEIIHRQSQRIGSLVEQLLALSELEARDPSEALVEDVTLVDVTGHVADSLRVRADARHITIAMEVPDDLVVKGESEGIERVLINLVDNAIKYGKEGGRVDVRARRVDEHVELVVADDGPGIPEEHRGRIFERFYRVDPGRSRDQGGSGLGLSIVKHIVEAMDGSIAVESDEKGTRFVVRLPSATR